MKKVHIAGPIWMLLLLSTSCSTTRPESVPRFRTSELPVLELKGLQPRIVELKIENQRKVNQVAGNAALVEKAVYDAVGSTLGRGGLKLGSSKNKLVVRIQDCANNSRAGTECVTLVAFLQAPLLELGFEGSASHGIYRNENAGYYGGDVSEAYQNAIELTLNGLESQMAKYHGNRSTPFERKTPFNLLPAGAQTE